MARSRHVEPWPESETVGECWYLPAGETREPQEPPPPVVRPLPRRRAEPPVTGDLLDRAYLAAASVRPVGTPAFVLDADAQALAPHLRRAILDGSAIGQRLGLAQAEAEQAEVVRLARAVSYAADAFLNCTCCKCDRQLRAAQDSLDAWLTANRKTTAGDVPASPAASAPDAGAPGATTP